MGDVKTTRGVLFDELVPQGADPPEPSSSELNRPSKSQASVATRSLFGERSINMASLFEDSLTPPTGLSKGMSGNEVANHASSAGSSNQTKHLHTLFGDDDEIKPLVSGVSGQAPHAAGETSAVSQACKSLFGDEVLVGSSVSLFEKPALQRGPVQGQSSHEKKSQLGIVSQPRPPIVGQVPLSRSPEHDSEDVLGSSAGAGTSTQSLAVPELEATKTSDGEAANSLLPATSQFPAQDSDQGLNLNVPCKKLAVPTCAEAQTDLPCQDTINDKASPNVVPTAEETTSVPSQTSIPAVVKPLLFAPEHVAK